MWRIKTYGRKTIYVPYTETQLLGEKDEQKLVDIVIDIIEQSKNIHEKNHNDSVYLKNYYYGDQDIYREKIKHTRPEIDNKTVENWAYAIIDFKKTYLLGKPIQYVQLNDAGEEEISKLNQYVRYENKKAKDMMAYEDALICGRAFRYINKDSGFVSDESPFEIINCPVEDTEVVYSNALGHEQILSYIKTNMEYIDTSIDENGKYQSSAKNYDEYTVYLRNKQLVINNKSGAFKLVGQPIPLTYNEHLIHEIFLNEKRIGLIELGKDLFNDINYLESLDKDDMEQFVNAIMVFTNAEVSSEDLSSIKELGAVCINSTDQKKASIDLLQGRLNATDTQTYYNRLLTALHQILAVPTASDSGTVTSGDTGKAKLTGQGFTSAGIRAEGDETMFGMCDYECLKVVLAICRNVEGTGITALKASDIDTKFQRDMSDNLLVKTQGLMNLYACDIPRKYANSIVNLFGDSNAVTKEQEKIFGEQVSQQGKGTSNNTSELNETKAQNNNINNAGQKENQGQ